MEARSTNWTHVPCPSSTWARAVYPELHATAALERLWRDVTHVCRLDEPDPSTSWEARFDTLEAVAVRLAEAEIDTLHFIGPGTDLSVGLLRTSRWLTARTTTVDGVRHVVNIPSEEVFTAPDPDRVDGIVRVTRPLNLAGLLIRGLTLRFENGRATDIEAESGVDALRAHCSRDAGAARLGEVALVDGESRVFSRGVIFRDTLLDENATAHIGLGDSYAECVDEPDRARRNRSQIHTDVMIGGLDVDVTGITASGRRVPVLQSGMWKI